MSTKIDFWKDYNPSSNEKIPSMRGIDYERIKAYCEARGVDMYKQSINAKFMNKMEEWYLDLAEQYPALDKIKAEIEQLPTKTRTNWDGCCPDIDYPEIEYVDVTKNKLLSIIDKHKAESEDKK